MAALIARRKGELRLSLPISREGPDDLLLVSRQPCRSSKRLPFGLGPVDLTSAAGRTTMGVLNAVAEFEKDLIVERTMAGLKRPEAVQLADDEDIAVLKPVEKASEPPSAAWPRLNRRPHP
jgi:hypothetical protein